MRFGFAAIICVILIVAVVVSQRDQTPSAPPRSESTVETEAAVNFSCVHAMIAAAQKGDLAGYRECFTGDLLRDLDARSQQKNSPRDPAEILKGAVTDLKGVATNHLETVSDDEARVALELIYADHIARQQLTLRFADGQWKIAQWTDPHRLRPDILYGTLVEGASP